MTAAQRLIRDAAEALDQLGYEGTTMGQLAQEMNVGEDLLVSEFGSKQGLADAVISAEHVLARRRAEETVAAGFDAVETMIRISAGVARQLIDDVLIRAGMQLAGKIEMSDVVRNTWAVWEDSTAELLALGIKQGDIEEDLDITVQARNVNSFFFGVHSRSWVTTRYASLMDDVLQMWIVIIRSCVKLERQPPLYAVAHEVILGR